MKFTGAKILLIAVVVVFAIIWFVWQEHAPSSDQLMFQTIPAQPVPSEMQPPPLPDPVVRDTIVVSRTDASKWTPISSVSISSGYAIHSGQVTLGGSPIDDADAATFFVWPPEYAQTYFAKDQNHVFDGPRIIKDADPASFVPILGAGNIALPYAIDKNHVYYRPAGADYPLVISGADSSTFIVIGSHFVDSPGYNGSAIFTDYYARDKNHVYFNTDMIQNADSSTFEYLGCKTSPCEYDARDKNHAYLGGKMVQ